MSKRARTKPLSKRQRDKVTNKLKADSRKIEQNLLRQRRKSTNLNRRQQNSKQLQNTLNNKYNTILKPHNTHNISQNNQPQAQLRPQNIISQSSKSQNHPSYTPQVTKYTKSANNSRSHNTQTDQIQSPNNISNPSNIEKSKFSNLNQNKHNTRRRVQNLDNDNRHSRSRSNSRDRSRSRSRSRSHHRRRRSSRGSSPKSNESNHDRHIRRRHVGFELENKQKDEIDNDLIDPNENEDELQDSDIDPFINEDQYQQSNDIHRQLNSPNSNLTLRQKARLRKRLNNQHSKIDKNTPIQDHEFHNINPNVDLKHLDKETRDYIKYLHTYVVYDIHIISCMKMHFVLD